jgi:hypothetical protein
MGIGTANNKNKMSAPVERFLGSAVTTVISISVTSTSVQQLKNP